MSTYMLEFKMVYRYRSAHDRMGGGVCGIEKSKNSVFDIIISIQSFESIQWLKYWLRNRLRIPSDLTFNPSNR